MNNVELTKNIGDTFKKKREQQMMSVYEAAQALNSDTRTVQKIENNKFGSFPGDTYAIGFIRNYARLLEIDEDKLVMSYERLKVEETEIPTELVQISKRKRKLLSWIIPSLIVFSFCLAWIIMNC